MIFQSLFQTVPAGAAGEDCAKRKAVRTLRVTATALPVPFLRNKLILLHEAKGCKSG